MNETVDLQKTWGTVTTFTLACVLSCPQIGALHKKSLQTLMHREGPMDAESRADFGCQHVRQVFGAPAGPGGAAVSWCVHASPSRHSVSLILVLSEKSESTRYRSDILNSISSPCVASGQAHVLSGRTLNIRCSCCQLPATPCPNVQTACKCLPPQSS